MDTRKELKLPLGITDDVTGGSLVIVSGTKNSGKSALLSDIAVLNMDNAPINYIFTENIRNTADRFLKWGFTAEDIMRNISFRDARDRAFEGHIAPNAINILDYYSDAEYSNAVSDIENMVSKIDDGILIVGIQRRDDHEYCRGGKKVEELAQLVIDLARAESRTGTITIKNGHSTHVCEYTFSDYANGSRLMRRAS